MGLDFDFVKGEGLSIHCHVMRPTSIACGAFEPREALGQVAAAQAAGGPRAAHRLWRRAVHAAYAIEGGPSTSYAYTKAFMYSEPAAWHRLCGFFADGRLPTGR